MGVRFRIVKGGTNESKHCDCNVVIERGKYTDVTCSCDETKYFAGNVPYRWICDYCGGGRHMYYGVRQ